MKRLQIGHAPAWLASTLLVSVLLAGSAAAQTPALQDPAVRYSRDPQSVVASFTEELAEMDDPDPGPSVTVYGDGRVRVHYPPYMKRAGDWELRLSEEELDALLLSLAGKLAVFDEQDARATLAQAVVQRRSGAPAEDVDMSDSGLTKIGLRLESFRPGLGAGPELSNVEKDIRWRGLRADAQRHTRVYEVQELAAAQQELLALMERPDLQKLP